MHALRAVALSALTVLPFAAAGQTSTANDAKVQLPTLAAPERGSLAGHLSAVAFGPGSLPRGAFALAAPISAPEDRGPLLASIFPTYSPEHGASEWGTGWRSSIAITRFRPSGELDYATDELTGPWGRMWRGTDGYWYPVGLLSAVRLEWVGDVLTAHLPDGTRMTFGGAARLSGPRGTFAWYLTDVETITGQRTRVEYETNATGRPFPRRVSYGGFGYGFQHQVELVYEPLARSVRDYRSGARVDLDRRVARVVCSSWSAVSGAFEERWRDELVYEAEAFGPGFFLTQIQRVHRSGDRPPPARYTYAQPRTAMDAAVLAPAPRLGPVLATLGVDALQPNRSSVLDAADDGLLDLEYANDYQLARQTESGYVFEPLPPAPVDVYASCRRPPSTSNVPRALAQLRTTEDTYYVADLRANPLRTQTTFSACDRAGKRLASQTLTGDWQLSSTIRLVDVDRDRRPDLVRVYQGGYRVLPNVSDASTFAFGAVVQGTLSPSFSPDTIWVQDMNGDGIVDLVARYSAGLVVWHGRGNLGFEPTGTNLTLRTKNGIVVSSLASFAVSLLDANKDGLGDVILTQTSNNAAILFMNDGAGELREYAVPALQSVDASTSRPVVGDFDGSGNTAVSYVRLGQPLQVVLDAPESGLMTSAGDGKGTVLRFEYARARSAAGAGRRQTVVSRVTAERSGHDPSASQFVYETPRVHGAGKFLVGFDRVTRTHPLGSETVTFENGDLYSGLAVGSVTRDLLAPGVEQYRAWTRDDDSFQGVPWKQPSVDEQGFRPSSGTGPIHLQRTRWITWQGLCSTLVEHDRTGGMLSVTTEPVDPLPAALGKSLACLPRRIVERGILPGGAVDFTHETSIGRNALGLVESVTSIAPEGNWRLQDVTYDGQNRVATVSAPGAGTTTAGYDAGSGVIRSVTSPVGSVVETVARDPITDFVTHLRSTGGTLVHDEFFRADGLERLQDSWDGIGSGTAFNPDLRLTYQYATATAPATVRASVLVDAARLSVREQVDLQTAAGEPVATATGIPEGWALGRLAWRTPDTGWTQAFARGALTNAQAPEATEYAELFQGAEVVESVQTGPLGVTSESTARLHEDVERTTTEALALGATGLVRTTRENGVRPTTIETDAGGAVLARTDEAGTRWTFVRDVLGRLREVRLPDGKVHRVSFDGHGRVKRVERDGIGAVEYGYHPTTGLLAQKRFLDATGALRRTVDLARDGIGRVTAETHRDTVTTASKTFRWYWDGATPEAPSATHLPGLLTAVTGDGFVKRFEYRSDGKLQRSTIELDGGWRTVETALTYTDSDELLTQETKVWDRGPTGARLLVTSSSANVYDGTGRLARVDRGGAPFVSFGFDAEGKLTTATLSTGEVVRLRHDPLTRAVTGSTTQVGAWSASVDRRMNARGLVERDTYAVGSLALDRSYGYTDQRFLQSSSDGGHTYQYDFDVTGLPTRVQEDLGSYSIARSGDTLTAGSITYRFDALGRTVQRGDLTFAYGPDGQLATASRGGVTWTFVHDESGQRLLKRRGAEPEIAYVDEGVLTGSELVEPVAIGEQTIGFLRNGSFERRPTDLLGTVIADADGTPRIASPFGKRDVHPSLAAALDYAMSGYDADLGTVRMGVRDYDAHIARFLTPDPLFLEEPQLCVESPIECALYGYARSAPTVYVDPTGTEGWQPPSFAPPGNSTEITTPPLASSLPVWNPKEWPYAMYQWPSFARGWNLLTNGQSAPPVVGDWVTLGPKTWVFGSDNYLDEVLIGWVDHADRMSSWRGATTVIMAYAALASMRGPGTGSVPTARSNVGSVPAAAPKLLPPGRYTPKDFAPGELEAHFAKHSAEWGAGNITQAAYLKRAQSLLGSDVGGDIRGAIRANNGDILRYNVRTNEFAVGAANGTIRTLFRPQAGMNYWLKQAQP